ncbi:class II histone deacetylase [Pseudonocardia sp. KRD-184]|uniref:Class II histone deacetylase n=1 Tax=Pseudonocardia oceani TaxID=2792013 RepID=A0ABS6UHW5_9PSEU|nr:class II histone deacetylase [Pseudonocardia oceani]MBW0093414.1 class II histone deacetylase [Pseudonocardia oceani]MBW0098747.1 class II histone deacetylase [Pseudonocardia oceani]MBW0109846.1 class II histone deacetylase [Pseudonocardia oceani]MBW0120083.1 class II histone deacetylase [Pseudonocardia oceani]MBW0131503.1 class II histone deacetylase [Pseudonocardia oceani]
MTTGYLWHALYGWNDTGSGSLTPADPAAGLQPVAFHIAHSDNKRRINELVEVSGLIDELEVIRPRYATAEEILRVHTAEHHDRIVAESALPKGGDAGDGISPFGRGGYEIAALAAGGAIAMVDAVVQGRVDNGYALVHPCGHHAVAETGMGFCVFNNVAIAAKHAKEALGVERIAIVDWDVHHGNGTQSIFWEDPSVLTVSLHQDRYFPQDQGFTTERGGGAGLGTNLNVPLPPGTGDAGYLRAMEDVVVPALRAFRPDLVIVGSGFDPSILDPMSHTMVSAAGFGKLTEMIKAVAAETSGGRLVMVQEGGYSIHYLAICGAITIARLAGVEPIDDPYWFLIENLHGREELTPAQVEVIEAARKEVDTIPGRST